MNMNLNVVGESSVGADLPKGSVSVQWTDADGNMLADVSWDTDGNLEYDYFGGIVPSIRPAPAPIDPDNANWNLLAGTFNAPAVALNQAVCGGNATCSLILGVGLVFLDAGGEAFEGYEASQGFSGVYDSATGEIGMVPSTYNDVIPEGWVAANGGHAEVSATMGGDPADHFGFAAVLQEDGSVQLKWTSGTLNSAYPDAQVPAEVQTIIFNRVSGMTNRPVLP